MLPNQVTVLADAAENVQEIDEQRAASARRRTKQSLKEGVGGDPDSYLKTKGARKRCILRLDAVLRYRQSRRSSLTVAGGI